MPREARKLTKATLDALRRKARADSAFSAYVADAGQPGLYAWARRGRVRFVFAYRPPGGGSRRRLQIDDYGAITLEAARDIAGRHRATVAAGGDPREEIERKAREAVTVREAVEKYLADLEQRAEGPAKRGRRSGYAEAKRLLERNVLPRLGKVPIRRVTVEQVRALHRSLATVEGNRTLTALSAVFGFVDLEGIVPPRFNPTRHVTRNEESGERRALTTVELEALGAVLREADQAGRVKLPNKSGKKSRRIHRSTILAIRLLALTGLRRSELLGHMAKNRRNGRQGLRWSDVDLNAGVVTLRETKTGRQSRVLGRAAVELLEAAKPAHAQPGDPVCPGAAPGQPLVAIDGAREALWKAAGLEGVDLHSLRHVFASVGAHVASGRYSGLVAPLLGHGHTRRSVTDKYITSDPEALRPAADAIAAEIAARLGLDERGRVLAFPERSEG